MDVDCPWQDRLLNKSKLATYKMLGRTAVFKYVCSRLPPVPGSDLQMMSVGFNRGYVLEQAFEDGIFTKSVYGFVAYKGALWPPMIVVKQPGKATGRALSYYQYSQLGSGHGDQPRSKVGCIIE